MFMFEGGKVDDASLFGKEIQLGAGLPARLLV